MGEKTFTYGSVCSGIEAATVAWHPLGWKPAFFSEIDAFPRAVLAHHYPDVPLHGDFTTIQDGDYDPIDLLVGGTPCQSFSVAGLRGGLDDERGNLALEYLRLAQRLRPRWLVWENVPGVLSSNGGRDFGAILGGMVELGYGVAYRVLDAQFFGVAQRRRRVFAVGYLGDWRRAAAVLFERHGLSGHSAPSREARKGAAISPSLRARANSSHRADSQAFIPDVGYALNAHGGAHGRQDAESETLIATTLRARDMARGVDSDCTDTLIAHSLRGEGFDASEGGTGRGTPIIPVRPIGFNSREELVSSTEVFGSLGSSHPQAQAVAYGITRDAIDRSGEGAAQTAAERSGLGITEELAQTIKAKGPGAVAFALRGRDGGAMPEIGGDQAGALRAAAGGSSRDYVALRTNQTGANGSNLSYGVSQGLSSDEQPPAVSNGSAVRRLTPTECERLQGFPDGYTRIGWRGKPESDCPDGPRYKALGNSMAVPCMSWIGRRIAAVEAISALEAAA